jgi:hypothetical protein
MYSLTMQRGKKAVFIGLFPSLYRAEVVECNLEWSPSWKPVIEQKEVNFESDDLRQGLRGRQGPAHRRPR